MSTAAYNSASAALKAGYRHIDSCAVISLRWHFSYVTTEAQRTALPERGRDGQRFTRLWRTSIASLHDDENLETAIFGPELRAIAPALG